ncbi:MULTISPECIES: hypothetical protein [Microbacterium]|uniref:hypothetical protein n=1 Tax=Microbacterium TaxID=33882 RepID=UPI0027899AF5|nr:MULTISPECIES: hypothetical protein [Microbacterium]MDQ1084183.1 hypothetical protein [Microbacterium sp. SORGH_AS_0344]MDQ1170542.1 hypothetical protein [Microbacterium proteolyticum]
MAYLANEQKHLDLIEWLDTLEQLGIRTADTFPAVNAANERADRILKIRDEARQGTRPLRQVLATIDLDDTAAVIAAVDRAAHAKNEEHTQRVADMYNQAADDTQGDAIRLFRRTDLLKVIRPVFDETTARILTAVETIPYGVMSIGDAARLGHGDLYTQLERDVQRWKDISELLTSLSAAGVVDLDEHYPLEAMVEDVQAYWDTVASSGRPMRVGRAIAAARPNLHIPTEPHIERVISPDQERWASEDANTAEKTARAALGLTDY